MGGVVDTVKQAFGVMGSAAKKAFVPGISELPDPNAAPNPPNPNDAATQAAMQTAENEQARARGRASTILASQANQNASVSVSRRTLMGA
jgi:hypothetical protein